MIGTRMGIGGSWGQRGWSYGFGFEEVGKNGLG